MLNGQEEIPGRFFLADSSQQNVGTTSAFESAYRASAKLRRRRQSLWRAQVSLPISALLLIATSNSRSFDRPERTAWFLSHFVKICPRRLQRWISKRFCAVVRHCLVIALRRAILSSFSRTLDSREFTESESSWPPTLRLIDNRDRCC